MTSDEESGGYVRAQRRVSTGEYEHLELECKLPINEGDEPRERMEKAQDTVDREIERRTHKRLLPETRRTGKLWMEREAEDDESDESDEGDQEDES